MSGNRPEHIAPPEVFYSAGEAAKYTNNTRVQSIQAEMTYRCLELLDLPASAMDDEAPRSSFLLDIGAGSGLSGEILTEEGHQWVGMDVSGGMLEVALEREVEGDLMLADIGQGIPYRPGSFDGAISVSVLQWLCNADSSSHSPAQRLLRFFTDLFGCLRKGSRAVFQFYPESDEQVKFIMTHATRAGFGGGLCVDYPNSSKKKKFYLILFAGQPIVGGKPEPISIPQGLSDEPSTVSYEKKRADAETRKKLSRKGKGMGKGKRGLKGGEGAKEYVLRKKELYRQKGKEGVPRDSKYTARSRKPRF
ncbi:williams-Beuren syndrome critical region protein 22 [Rhodotorula toruloides]|uniref:Williams-Beuren syndrome critical region protein 22 n=1 Tax=Rhodotorula toruloides TaxID=5286 RepID=A0A511KFC5_RHOTO|nr:williams-Beuren syndrome critical region protein 22 [Rhodotorula toruloides]